MYSEVEVEAPRSRSVGWVTVLLLLLVLLVLLGAAREGGFVCAIFEVVDSITTGSLWPPVDQAPGNAGVSAPKSRNGEWGKVEAFEGRGGI